jgi:hypothetical protein
MASIGQAWKLSMNFVDSGGNIAIRTVTLTAVDDAGDLSPVIADVATVVAAYVAATDAVLTSQTLSKTSVEDSVTLPAGNVNVEDNAQISAKIFGTPNKSGVFEIPAPKNTAFIAPTGEGHNKVNFVTGPIPAVVNLYLDGAQATLSDGESITAQNIKGKRVHHKSTKG